ncbi:syndetin [Condylostylus longicornis]|uniref:syndetin n=1 Tax=Condylostylus longicornis TaxID=2530218 RepID=UPI00244DBFAC|nr:syndetin [Condylostylus longicornis]
MDEIKSKFLNFVKKQNQVRIPTMGFSTLPYEHNTSIDQADSVSISTSCSHEINDTKDHINDEDCLKNMEKIFYEDEADLKMYIIKKVESGQLPLDKIQDYSADLRKKQKLLSRKLLVNISDQKASCNNEFQNILGIKQDLSKTLTVIQQNRLHLQFAKKNLTTISLEILAAYRKREKMKILIKIFNAINNIKTMDIKVQKLLNEGQYPNAIYLLLKCKTCISKLPNYNCVTSLDKKLQETLLMSELEMEKILYQLTENIDISKYKKLHEAYSLLKKSIIIMDQLHLNFISAIHVSYLQVVKKFVSASVLDSQQNEIYEDFCEKVPHEKYLICLVDLCKCTWNILKSYYQIISWHQNLDLVNDKLLDEEQNKSILDKLNNGKLRIWNDVQAKICRYLSSTQLKNLKYEQFIQALSIVRKLQKVGFEFCEDEKCSDKLINTIHLQSLEFFEKYHAKVVNEIILFFENESWLPVEFCSVLELQEFRFVKLNLMKLKSKQDDEVHSENESQTESQNQINIENSYDELVSNNSQDIVSSITEDIGYFVRYYEKSSPFDVGLDISMTDENFFSKIIDQYPLDICKKNIGIESSSTESSNEQLAKCDEMCANNTSINILRYMGRYLQMCKLLHPISTKIITSILELFDFYAFFIHEIFCKTSSNTVNVSNADLEIKLKHIEENIVLKVQTWPNQNFTPIIKEELENTETLYGLSCRIVAIQSGLSMLKQFQLLHQFLNKLLPNLDGTLTEVTEKHMTFFEEIAKLMYLKSISRILDSEEILNGMAKIKWDVNHVSTQHSFYIDVINRNCQTFAMKLEEISKIVEQIPYEIVWDCLVQSSTCLLVEGFSNVKKCTAGGRALMQLDFTYFISMVELISKQKFSNHRSYVDTYIKAYYLPLDEFIDWLKIQKDAKIYSNKQLLSLINCTYYGDKKTKTRLTEILDESNIEGIK